MDVLEKLKGNSKLAQFLRFVLVGGTATVIHYTIYLALGKIGVLLNIAYTIGYFSSFIFNFYASNYFTFKAKPSARGGIRFMGAHIVNYLLQIVLLNLYLRIGVPQVVAPVGVFAIAIPINFILVRIALK